LSSATCVLVTHHSLLDLASRGYGSMQRLRMLATAATQAGLELVVATTLPANELRGSLADTRAEIERGLREVWGVDARVVLAERAAMPTIPWVLQQASTLLSYENSWLVKTTSSPAFVRELAQLFAAEPALVIAYRLPSMLSVLRAGARAPVIFDLDDIEHRVAERGVQHLAGLRNRLMARAAVPAIVRAETGAVRHAALTLVCSPDDAQVVADMAPGRERAVHVMPNSVDLPPPAPLSTEKVLLMVGIYSYGPNKDGADYFIREVYPRIARADARVEAWFAGASRESLECHANPPAGVKLLGFVDSLAEVYRRARVVICPIRYGGGTRIKLVEAAAWGKPIVTTTLGAEGLGMVPGEHALFADEAEGFAAACLRLLDDQDLPNRLGTAARELADRNFRRENVVRNLAIRMQEVLAPRP